MRLNKHYNILLLFRVIELTGDSTPDIRSIKQSDIIVTTPEKWDGISRSWQNRSYVQVHINHSMTASICPSLLLIVVVEFRQ